MFNGILRVQVNIQVGLCLGDIGDAEETLKAVLDFWP